MGFLIPQRKYLLFSLIFRIGGLHPDETLREGFDSVYSRGGPNLDTID